MDHVQEHKRSKSSNIMKEELHATWYATALILCVIGANFSSRSDVSNHVRTTIDILFLTAGLWILLWATCSFIGILNYKYHYLGLYSFLFVTFACLIYLIVLSAIGDV